MRTDLKIRIFFGTMPSLSFREKNGDKLCP